MDATGQQQTRLNGITKLGVPKVEKGDVSKKKRRGRQGPDADLINMQARIPVRKPDPGQTEPTPLSDTSYSRCPWIRQRLG